jgi:hypothetical protein
VLLPEKSDAVDDLLGARTRCVETSGESGVFALEILNALRRDDSLHSRRLETLEPRLGLQCAASKGRELITEVMNQLLELGKGGYLRPCVV